MQTSFQNMRTNFFTRNLTTGPPLSLPNITPWMHKHDCAPHITPPRGACMALVPHCDTNQGRWRPPLSCKHQSLLVLFKCLPSLSLLPHSRSTPTLLHSPSSLLTPDFSPLSVFLSFSSPSKSSLREESAFGALGC